MAIVRWEPFRELLTTQDRFNQLFNQAFSQVFGSEGQETPAIRAWAPAADIYETEHNLVDPFELDSSLLLSSGRHGEDRKRQYHTTLRHRYLAIWLTYCTVALPFLFKKHLL